MDKQTKRIAIIGGGAAGFFAAARINEIDPSCRIDIYEKTGRTLQKVKISGGGRCNITHACFDPNELVKYYPRGEQELRGPFHQFAPGDTMEWFSERGVELKIEEDNRVFPVSNDSQTIIDCLRKHALKQNTQLHTNKGMVAINNINNINNKWQLRFSDETEETYNQTLIATGASPMIWNLLKEIGVSIISPVPSLFTFKAKDAVIDGLQGLVNEQTKVSIEGTSIETEGPLLITHWGMSGPAILKASAWGAVELNQLNYQFNAIIDWIPSVNENELKELIHSARNKFGKKLVVNENICQLPKRLWQSICEKTNCAEDKWAELSKKKAEVLIQELKKCKIPVTGKSTNKDEFVTAGGVDLKEINFKSFEHKSLKGLYFAGEVMNIDAITGGFNFQAAWTGGWIAANHIVEAFNE